MNCFRITATVVAVSFVAFEAFAQVAPESPPPLGAAPGPQIGGAVPEQPGASAESGADAPGTWAGGCWVRFYDGVDYRGDQVTLLGPLDVPNVAKRTGKPWRDWDSAVVGPRARVITYDAENFGGQSAVLNPREQVADMAREKTEIFANIESVRVSCSA